MELFELSKVDASWRPLLEPALATLPDHYIEYLQKNPNWLPGKDKLLNAFSLPKHDVKYILYGESPYPRPQSANGYAFWDGAVRDLWAQSGLATAVNRATSLRNFCKMLLVAAGKLVADDTSQDAIAGVDKTGMITTIDQLFNNMLNQGILLLNASLALSPMPVAKEAVFWRPFAANLLGALAAEKQSPPITLILLGKIAQAIDRLPPSQQFPRFYAPHPYNLSFISDPTVLDFFRPFTLLNAR